MESIYQATHMVLTAKSAEKLAGDASIARLSLRATDETILRNQIP
jgi:hypothetical protein